MNVGMRRPFKDSKSSYSFYPFHELIRKDGCEFMKVGIRYHFHPSRRIDDPFVQRFIKDKTKQGYRLYGAMTYREDYVIELVKEIVPIREWVLTHIH